MTINTSGSLYGTTVHSNLTLTVASRTTSGVKFNYSITSYLNAGGYVSGETYSGKITISGSNITTKVTNLTIKPYADYWSGTTQHTITGTIDVVTSSYADLTASVSYEVTTSASSDKNSGTGTIKTGSGQPPLTASSVSASASVTAGNNISVTVTPYSNFYSVKHTVAIYIGNNKIAETNIAASTTAKTVSINIPTSAANYITNAMSGTATVTATTFSGTTNVGSKSVNTTINVPAYTLTGSISALPVAETQFSGKNLQGVTAVDVAVSGVSNYGATLSYKATIDGVAYNTSAFTTAPIKQSGSVVISATITDSRGKTATVNATALSYEAYTIPSITSLSAGRNSGTPSNVNIVVQGTFATVGGSNSVTAVCELAGSSGSASASVSPFSMTITMTANPLQSYSGTVYVEDTVGNKSATYVFTISTQAVQIDLHNSGKGVAMGKTSETSNLFECEYNAQFNGGVNIAGDNVADFIVEQGTSSIWTYRKWHSGIAECWGIITESISFSQAWGGLYLGRMTSTSFPSGLFLAAPFVNVNAHNANGVTPVLISPSNTATGSMGFVKNFSGSASTNIYIQAKGPWK